ncbi:MAG: Fic family protein [Candidatus Omnitrophica bacterium]|nr:Fic family protein [Candidatus Omnitrophota bacterium]
MIWKPTYQISPAVARALMDIEAAKAVVEKISLSPAVQAVLRHKARVRSTHYSTRIEGNRLTLKEAEKVIEEKKANFHGRERDVSEVRNYWDALLKVEDWAGKKISLSEDFIRRLHAIIEKGKRAKPTPYREGQNVIRDSASGKIVYLPPEAKDVALLMDAMVRWAKQAEKEHIPPPVIAALLHYQFVTIHPYYDGNGRTARLLSTFILQRDGYGLNGFFSLEEHHARDLEGYYRALATHKHHNYYQGRADVDLTAWVEYFVKLLAKVFQQARDEALRAGGEKTTVEPEELRRLDHRAKTVLALFAKKDKVSVKEIAETLGLSDRMARNLAAGWVKDGWLVILNESNRARSYGLSKGYEKFLSLKR